MKATALCGIRGVTWMTGIESEFVKPLGQRDIPALGKPDRSRLVFQPALKSEPHRPLPTNSRLLGFPDVEQPAQKRTRRPTCRIGHAPPTDATDGSGHAVYTA